MCGETFRSVLGVKKCAYMSAVLGNLATIYMFGC
jgi:hypothetical protein